ncbi:MAG: hypothetical protein A3A86_07100 [Elusimicrobia bacterium RIFCSPLOWO2_01_FULL_60_11]|nr:MAG: hypothetical protein A3A86_07100 [Elusimicrobia bacterium RIFCSPLOWO2_01_FULL_60_11]
MRILLILLLAAPLHAAADALSLEQDAHALFFRGHLTKSVQVYKKALEADPQSLSARLNLACAYRALSNDEAALGELEKAIGLAPADPDVMAESGWSLYRLGRFEESASRFEQALKLSPKHFNALLGLGAARMGSGQSRDAVGTLKRLCELRPNFGGSAYFLSKAYEKNSQMKEAREQYAVALRRDWTLKEQEAVIQEAPAAPAKLPELAFTAVQALALPSSEPALRVGLWAGLEGRSAALGRLEFESSGPFQVVGERTKKIFAEGNAGERWTVLSGKKGVSLRSAGGAEITGIAAGLVFKPASSSSTFLVQDIRLPDGTVKPVSSREFRGTLTIYPQRRGARFTAVNELLLDEYLLGVLPSEMPASWPTEGLKAQAVIARNYALAKKGSLRAHLRNHYQLCDSQHCQVYQGARAEKERTTLAVRETAGRLLYHGDRLVQSYYYSTCGGRVQSADDVKGWGGAPYLHGKEDLEGSSSLPKDSPWELFLWLKSVPASNCNDPALIPNSEFRWLRVVTPRAMEKKLRKFRLGRIKEVIPLSRSASGRVNEVLVRGTKRETVLKKEHQIRFGLGEESLRSTLFWVETVRGADGFPKEFWIYGGGWGHGIGLCQAGAAGLAKNSKKTFEEILQFYYEGSRITGQP